MVDGFLKKVKDALVGNDEEVDQGVGDELRNPQDYGQYGDVSPASEDPYGDPADQVASGEYGDVSPASEDPYGDPADQVASGEYGDVSPASEDPYGDPADQQYNA